MGKSFIPSKDGELVTWSADFAAKLTSTPTAFGCTAGQATAYATLDAAFAAAVGTATDPSTRTRGTVAAKDAAKVPLVAMARELARIINAFPGITNQQRIDLGLTPRSGQVSPINPPAEAPVLEVVAAVGRTLKLKLRSIDSDRRGKPAGVAGASLFSYVGASAPADVADWTFEGSTTRTTFDLEFPPTVAPGAQVWLTAFWFNPRTQSGPACTPECAYVAGGVAVSQAA
jgi:hypothetical protein